MASMLYDRRGARKGSHKLTVKSEAAIAEGKRLRAEAKRLIDEAKQIHAHTAWLIEDCKRRWEKGFYQELQKAIRVNYGCESEHLASFAVRKVIAEQTVWEGMVEEFRLLGHPAAERCYAWHYLEDGKRWSFSLLKLPPVDSPQRAVQLALAARELSGKLPTTPPDSARAKPQAMSAKTRG